MKKPKTPVAKPSAPQASNYFYWLLFAIPFLLYARTIGFGFVYHDDDVMILDGAAALQRFNIKELFTTDAWLQPAHIELYRPWQSFTYAIDYALGNGSPGIFHFHNLIVFCFCILLFYRLLLDLKIEPVYAFGAAALYSIHFTLFHVVCWIPARGDLYLCLFSLATILLWLKYNEKKDVRLLAALPLLYLLTLFAKESGVVLPVLLFSLQFLYYRTSLQKMQGWLPYLLFIPVLAIYLYLQKQSVASGSNFLSIGALLYNLPVLPEEIAKFFVPFFSSVLPSFTTLATVTGLVAIAGIAAALYYQRKVIMWPLVLTGLVFFLVPLLPSLLYKPKFTLFTYDYLDHRMFFPYAGLLLVCLALLLPVLPRLDVKRWAVYPALAIAACSFYLSGAYQNGIAYYQNATATNPQSGLAWLNYSRVLDMEKRYPETLETLNHLIQLYPDSVSFQLRKAAVYIETKDFNNMMRECRRLISTYPTFAEPYYYLAGYYNDIGQTDSAYNVITAAIQADSSNPMSYLKRSSLLIKTKQYRAALDDMGKSIALNPNMAQAYFERGNLYGGMGLYMEALDDFKKYVELLPNNPLGLFYRGQAYYFAGLKEEGCMDLKNAAMQGVAEAKTKAEALCR
ncbi:MAG TPA: tetratricopeptide repeat protein [Chitinophagales bacterium]|nr:tetratricopeptide repeat protein [Chitinophagales bacterium]